MRIFFFKNVNKQNLIVYKREVTPRMQSWFKIWKSMFLPITRPGKKSNLIISVDAERQTIGHCLWKQGFLLLFNFPSLLGKEFAVPFTEVFWFYLFQSVITFQTECRLFTLELLSTDRAALCWLLKSCLCATVQVTIESGSSLCSSKVSTSEKDAPFSWVSPPYILQVEWPYVSWFHCII